jgi:tetratricopeptide (TPR) repeat protein
LEAKNPEAVAAAEQILKLVQTREPENPDAAYGVAMLRHMTGQKIEAIPLYERALELQPENVIAMNNLAWILSQEKGEHNKALALADKGISLSPKYTDLIDTRGTIYMSMGQYEKAALDFKQAAERYLDTQTEKTSSTFNLAKCYRQLGRIDLSLIESYKARDLDEKNNGLTPQQRAELAEMLKR